MIDFYLSIKSLFQSDVVIHAAYGSSKDIWVYQQIGLRQDQIYIVGKVSKKHQTNARVSLILFNR